MIIYFCDRQLNILGHATTVLPSGNRVSQDKTVEDVESGVNSFECVVSWDNDTRYELENAIKAGNYVLKKGGSNGYDSLYQIIETEADTLAQEIFLYAEDAGLDLLNTLCPAVSLSNRTLAQMLRYFLPADWAINIQDAPTTAKSWVWDGESTCTERIRSVVGIWDCELYYSFTIDALQVKEKIVNVVKKRGLQEAIPQLRLNYDIDRIITRTSIADLVTALNVTGGTPEGTEVPINLVGYSYSYTDPITGDLYRVDTATGQMRNVSAMDRWSSAIDTDGLWVGSYSFDTTDKATLAGQARAELQRLSAPAVNYEVDFAQLPDDAQIGDRVNIIDDEGELYLEARLLLIETCEAEQTKKATIGEYLLKTSGISEKVLELAAQVKRQADSDQYFRDQIQILTETTASMLNLEVQSNIVAGKAFLRAHLFNGGKEVTTEYSEALYKWIKRSEDGEELLGRGYTINIDLEEMGYASTILCRFIRPVLYDLTDHMLVNITDHEGNNIQVAYSGIYSQPVVRRMRALKALNRASETNETGYPNLVREVNLYDHDGLEKRLDPIVQHFWTDEQGAHITEVPRDDFIQDPANEGGNLLARSQGVYIRNGEKVLADFENDGLTIYVSDKQKTAISAAGINFTNINGRSDANAYIGTSAVGLLVDDNWFQGTGVEIKARPTSEDGNFVTAKMTAGSSILELQQYRLNGQLIRSAYLATNGAGFGTSVREETNYKSASMYSGGGGIRTYTGNSGNSTIELNTQNSELSFSDTKPLEFGHENKSYTRIRIYNYDGTFMWVGIGADGTSQGLYSEYGGNWIIRSDGYGLYVPMINNSVTSVAGNVYVEGANGELSKGSSSSKRYKKDIKDIKGELDPAKLYDVKVRQFKYRADYLNKNDQRYGKDVGGFIAEELLEVYPIAVDMVDDQAEDWNYRYLLPPMLKLIQDQKKEIDELRNRIEKLEER